jgi:hypothetical protein
MNGEPGLIDDQTNKAVVVCTHMAISYTGLAQINLPQSTDDWIIETLKDLKNPPVVKVLHQLKRSANRDFRHLNLSKTNKRHAFVVAGWTSLQRDQALTPFVASVSNALSKSWTWEKESRSTFKVDAKHLYDTSVPHLFWFGQPFNDSLKNDIFNEIVTEVRKGNGPSSVIQTLQLAFRHIADMLGPSGPVGKNLMVVSFPRRAAGKMGGLVIPLTDNFPNDAIVAKFLWEGQDVGKRLGPDLIACHPGGNFLMADLSVSVSPKD